MSDEENGIVAYDLEPPGGFPRPHFEPLRAPFGDRGPSVRPRYVPGPQPEGTVRVVLDDEGPDGEPADFRLYDDYPVLVEPYRVFDVPQEVYERWTAAKQAFGVMREEIEAAVSDRSWSPPPVPAPGLPY